MSSPNGYDCLIFDLGGVLLNIDYNLTAQAFKELGVSHFDDLYSQAKQSNLFDDFETGKISSDQFRDRIRQMTNLSLVNKNIDLAWNSMLLDFPIHRMELLESLGKNHQLILLSNTNEIHVKAFTKIINASFGMDRFEAAFDRVYYSSSIGMRKPNKETFEWILSMNKLSDSNCWFVDDSIQHIEGARLAGIEAHWLKPGMDISQVFLPR